MSGSKTPKTCIIVDVNGERGQCCHCGESADISKRHSCGAEVLGVAINILLAPKPSFEEGVHVNTLLRGKDIPFVGAGHIVQEGNRTRFKRTMKPGDMS